MKLERQTKSILKYLILFMSITAFYILTREVHLDKKPRVIQILMFVCLCGMVGQVMLKRHHKVLKMEDLIIGVIFGGLVMRIGYMLYTGCDVRAYDVYDIDIYTTGNAGYLLQIMQNKSLPYSNLGQWYQQPLFYLAAAAVSWVVNGILGCEDPWYLVDAGKIVSCFASCGTLFVADAIFKECKMQEKGKLAGMMIVAFFPACYLVGGGVNCNALSIFLMALALLYTMRWWQEQSWKNTILLAVIYGFGMMTKISCAMLALLTALVFLARFIDTIRHGKIFPLLGKYLIFGLISLPLGLWYGVRNYLLFQQPLNYVWDMGNQSQMYTGGYSIPERILWVDFKDLFATPYANSAENYNFIVYWLKTSVFGEFTHQVWGIIPVLLLVFRVFLAAFVILALIWQFRENRQDKIGLCMAGMLIFWYVGEIFFYIRYPQGCSMDFRYSIICLIPIAVVLGKYVENKGKYVQSLGIVLIGFTAFSCLMYLFI